MIDLIERTVSQPAGPRGSPVFKDASALTFHYRPVDLPGRERELEWVEQRVQSLIVDRVPRHMMIHGPVGSGKTVVTRVALARAQAAARTRGRRLTVVEVNCRLRKGIPDVLHAIISQVDPNFPDRGFSQAETLSNLRARLAKWESDLAIVLDEADYHVQAHGSDLVYAVARFTEEAATPDGPRACVILTSITPPSALLDDACLSTIGMSNVLRMKPYSRDDLSRIVAARSNLALRAGTLTPAQLDAAADEGFTCSTCGMQERHRSHGPNGEPRHAFLPRGDARPAIATLMAMACSATDSVDVTVTPATAAPTPTPRGGGDGSPNPNRSARMPYRHLDGRFLELVLEGVVTNVEIAQRLGVTTIRANAVGRRLAEAGRVRIIRTPPPDGRGHDRVSYAPPEARP